MTADQPIYACALPQDPSTTTVASSSSFRPTKKTGPAAMDRCRPPLPARRPDPSAATTGSPPRHITAAVRGPPPPDPGAPPPIPHAIVGSRRAHASGGRGWPAPSRWLRSARHRRIWVRLLLDRCSIIGSMLPGPALHYTHASCRVLPATTIGCLSLLARAPLPCATA
ncbi:hypothetical protein COCNU_16G000520 [Cocos nucifera]|uniref:Uncharacterized protein n=1 Tax=Cocos nucifera TaxID=13894 RepID=A0A8K0IXL4_COCNU|nr:hypothetical protein COCNU_16G000520 [Cocos nucifera]